MQNKIYKLVKAAALVCFVLGAGFLYTYETEAPQITEVPVPVIPEVTEVTALLPAAEAPQITAVPQVTETREIKKAGTAEETPDTETKKPAEPSPTETTDTRININTAGVAELIKIPGIGEVKASAIISYRNAHGPFKRIEDIMKIPGIKNGVFQKAKDHIRVE